MDDKIYNKYKTELDALKKYVNNDYIYNLFYNYGFTINNKFIQLDSNINIYEACFISQLINIYIDKYKKKSKLNILEIGFAYGTSTLIILNQILNYKNTSYDIIDLNQTKQWNNIGVQNVEYFFKYMKKKINYNLYEESSLIAIKKLKKKYDISFIDGSHERDIVISDIINSDKKLIINGLIIIDDVLHKDVKLAILDFVKEYKNYRRISIKNNDYVEKKILYDKKQEKKSFYNPKTMFCFQKIF